MRKVYYLRKRFPASSETRMSSVLWNLFLLPLWVTVEPMGLPKPTPSITDRDNNISTMDGNTKYIKLTTEVPIIRSPNDQTRFPDEMLLDTPSMITTAKNTKQNGIERKNKPSNTAGNAAIQKEKVSTKKVIGKKPKITKLVMNKVVNTDTDTKVYTVRVYKAEHSATYIGTTSNINTDVDGTAMVEQKRNSETATKIWTTVPPEPECVVEAVSTYARTILDHHLYFDEISVIEYNVTFKDYDIDILATNGSDLFRPYHWVRTSDPQGRALLHLNKNYNMMSLATLSIGVEYMNVTVKMVPKGCILNLTQEQKLIRIRKLLLNDFILPSPDELTNSLTKDNFICNMHIINDGGYAVFIYSCCHIDPTGEIVCHDQVGNVWIDLLMAFITCTKVVLILYSPIFLPKTFYGTRFAAIDYTFLCPDGRKKLKIVKTRYPHKFRSRNKAIMFQRLVDMKYFQTMLRIIQAEKVYQIAFDTIHLEANHDKLLSKDVIPVGVDRVIYDNLFRCKLKYLPTFQLCCDTHMFGNIYPGLKEITWYKCLLKLAYLILLFTAALPWIVRMVLFYKYEELVLEVRQTAAAKLNLTIHYENIMTYLKPHHPVFITMYCIVLLGILIYFVLKKQLKDNFKCILMRNYLDRQTEVRARAASWALRLLLQPFIHYGIFGLLLAIPYCTVILPFWIVPVLAFYMFPFLNLNVRLFVPLLPKAIRKKFHEKTEKITVNISTLAYEISIQESKAAKYQSYFSVVVAFVSLISFWSLTFLLMECLSFYVEMLIYTITGIIVNAEHMIRYITVLFFVYMYIKDTFSVVDKVYRAYYNIIFEFLLAEKKADILETARLKENIQQNMVFRIERPGISENRRPYAQLEIKNGQLSWNTNGFLIFLDKYDKPYTPVKFFHRSIKINSHGCPGELWFHILEAFLLFGKMVLLLLFVATIVMAFGDAYNISATNQVLITVTGGFLPFVFKTFMKSPKGDISVKTDSIQFIAEFDEAINTFQQSWPVADIVTNTYEEYKPTKTNCYGKSKSMKSEVGNDSVESSDAEGTATDDLESSLMNFSNEYVPKVDLIIDITDVDGVLWKVDSASVTSTCSNINYKKTDNILDL